MPIGIGYGLEDLLAQLIEKESGRLGGFGRIGVGGSSFDPLEKIGDISTIMDLLFKIQDRRLKLGNQLGIVKGLAQGLGGGSPRGFTFGGFG